MRIRRIMMLALAATALAIAAASPLLADGEQVKGPQVTLTTVPAPSEIVPDLTLARVKLAVIDRDGRPITNVVIGMDLVAPASGPFISTDFPLVEGTKLLSYRGASPDGTLEFDYLWPIRGRYDVTLTASPAQGSLTPFDPITTHIGLSLNENPAEVNNAIMMVALLGAFGLVSGLVLGRSLKLQREEG